MGFSQRTSLLIPLKINRDLSWLQALVILYRFFGGSLLVFFLLYVPVPASQLSTITVFLFSFVHSFFLCLFVCLFLETVMRKPPLYLEECNVILISYI